MIQRSFGSLVKLAAAVLMLVGLSVSSPVMAETNAHAKAGGIGIGLGGGNFVSGLSAKYFLSDKMALQAVVGSGWGGLGLGADLIFEMPSLWSNGDLNLNWNLGAGAAFASGGWGSLLGINGVAGLSLQIKKIPLEFTTEFRPFFAVLDDSTHSSFYTGGGGSIRYYFK